MDTGVDTPFTSSTTLVNKFPKFAPATVTVAPVVGTEDGERVEIDGGAYARPVGTNVPDCPKTVTVTKEMAPEPTGRAHCSQLSGSNRVQLVAEMSPKGTRTVTWVKFTLGPRLTPVIASRVPPVELATVTPAVANVAFERAGGATLERGTALA